MTETEFAKPRLFNGWRIAGWGAALALLLLPALAMHFTGEVSWTAGDFLFAAVLLGALGAAMETAIRFGKAGTHRAGMLAASLAGFLTVWINAAVGIIGEGPINIAFFAMVLLAIAASLLTRFRARAMAAIMAGMVAGQIAMGLIAEFTGQADWGPVAFMAVIWLVPAALFRLAAAD